MAENLQVGKKIERDQDDPAMGERALLVGFFHLGRLAEVQNLPGPVPGEHAVGSLCFERNHGHFPRPRTISHGNTPARQTLERLELESSSRPCPRYDCRRCSHDRSPDRILCKTITSMPTERLRRWGWFAAPVLDSLQ
jgi:hypothetical protein